MVAKIGWHGKWQYYFLAEVTGGTFGSSSGQEMTAPLPERGTYRPMWMTLAELLEQPVKPRELAEIIVRFSKEGWPEEPVIIPE